jgi:transposase-like protein
LAFKWRQFAGEVILWAVRWCYRYGISYRELEEMLRERGVEVDHTTLYRWTQRYVPELEKRTAWYRSRLSLSWRVDETYVRVKGRWKYLYRAIDKDGATLDFFLADRRNTKAASSSTRSSLNTVMVCVPADCSGCSAVARLGQISAARRYRPPPPAYVAKCL